MQRQNGFNLCATNTNHQTSLGKVRLGATNGDRLGWYFHLLGHRVVQAETQHCRTRGLVSLCAHGTSPSCWSWAWQSRMCWSTEHQRARLAPDGTASIESKAPILFFSFLHVFFLPPVTQNTGTRVGSVHTPAVVEQGRVCLLVQQHCGTNKCLWCASLPWIQLC